MEKPEQKKPSSIKTAMRIPTELHEELAEAAKRSGHSMNAEIIARLSARPGGITLTDIAMQNEQTQRMIQSIIDALSPRR